MRRRYFVIAVLSVFISGFSWSQTIFQPNFGLKSHETLVINKIETTPKATTFFMTVENRIQGGTFCADKNIFIICPDGSRSKLVIPGGIPVCPQSYKFKTIGEKLNFNLTFPPLKPETGWIDIIEECSENCFYFYGIVLDNDLNQKIDNAFNLAGKGESALAMNCFINILEATDTRNTGPEGLLYVNITKLAWDAGNKSLASEWYNKLSSSGIPRLSQYLKFLNDQGIKY